jgi:hypothetical protein
MPQLRFMPYAGMVGLAVILSSVPTLSAQQDSSQRSLKSSLNISYSLRDPNVPLHVPVIVVLRILNDSTQTIDINLGQDRKGAFSFSITRPDGTKSTFPPFIREGISVPGLVKIEAGKSYTQDLLLNEWYDFPMPGTYELEGSLSNPIEVAGRATRDTGFHEIVSIGARDELALAKVCDTLAAQVEGSSSYDAAAQAALTLSYVRDSVAVPFLRRVLFSGRLVEPIAINGLENIKDSAAVGVLAESLSVKSTDASMLARAALERIQKQTSDFQVRQTIDRALAQH